MTSGYLQSDDSDTVISTHGSESESTVSIAPPAPPVNSPDTMSEVGGVQAFDFAQMFEKLGEGSDVPTPPSSTSSSFEGKARMRGPVRSELSLHKQLFKQLPPPARKKKITRNRTEAGHSSTRKKKHSNTSPPDEHVHEHSTWMAFALEDLDRALKRLAVGAKDEHKINDSKTVEEYYSENLADQINKAEMLFDSKYLK